MLDAAVSLAEEVRYLGVGTFEFLADPDAGTFAFIEANPRLQVEHTVTEEVTGVDLVKVQLGLASGRMLNELGIEGAEPHGFALEARVNLETMAADGTPRPAGGTPNAFEPPPRPRIPLVTLRAARCPPHPPLPPPRGHDVAPS